MAFSVETPLALFEEPIERLPRHAVEATQMPLGLVPEVLDAVDMVSGFNKPLRVIDAMMSELRDIQSIITQKAIRIDNAVRFDRPSNDRNQCILLGIRDDVDVHFATSLEQPEYGNFTSRAASALPYPGATKIAFVDFNLSRKPRLCFGELQCNQLAQLMEIKRCCMPIYADKFSRCARCCSSNKLSNLPGASRADAILPEEGEEVVEANARLRDRLTSPVVIAAQPAIETALDTSPVEPVAFAIRPAESRSELNDRSLEMQNREEVAEPQQVSPPSPRTKAEAVAITDQGGDVFEHDPGLWKIWDITDKR